MKVFCFLPAVVVPVPVLDRVQGQVREPAQAWAPVREPAWALEREPAWALERVMVPVMAPVLGTVRDMVPGMVPETTGRANRTVPDTEQQPTVKPIEHG